MKLGVLSENFERWIVPVTVSGADARHVRISCKVCKWTVAFTTTPEGADRIVPDHPCPGVDPAFPFRAPLGNKPSGSEVM